MKILKNNLFFIYLLVLSGCSSFVEVDPPKSQLVTESVYQNDNTANSAVVLCYALLAQDIMTYNMPLYTGLYSDELLNNDAGLTANAYMNDFEPVSFAPVFFWNNIYKYIYMSNAIVEGTEASTGMSEQAKSYFKGEALFLRAYWYFYLINLYGDVPLILTTDYAKNAQMPSFTSDEVYKQIETDLKKAIELLPDTYLSGDGLPGSAERVRANKNAARAMLARVYLYTKHFAGAETYSSSIISQTSLFEPVAINSVFLKNSKETILAIPPTASSATYNTREGNFFVVRANRATSIVSPNLLNTFSTNDQRLQNWIGFRDNTAAPLIRIYFPNKYKKFDGSSITEYSIMLRVAEQYLIRAEARAELGNFQGAQDDLNVIRRRAGVALSTASSKETLIEEITNERQKELFTEWGHRWLDLKRTGKVNTVMGTVTPLKGGVWSPYKVFWPIQQNEILLNKNLNQVDGYPK